MRKGLRHAFRSFFGLVRDESKKVATSKETKELLNALEEAASREEKRLKSKLKKAVQSKRVRKAGSRLVKSALRTGKKAVKRAVRKEATKKPVTRRKSSRRRRR